MNRNFAQNPSSLSSSRRRGAVLVITAFAMVVILGMMSLVFDLAVVYKNEAQLRRALNLAAIHAATVLAETGQVEACLKEAETLAAANGVHLKREDIRVNPLGNNADFIQISKSREVPIQFGRVFRVTSMKVVHSALTFAHPENEAVLFNDFLTRDRPNYDPMMPSAFLPLALAHGRLDQLVKGELAAEATLFKPGEEFKSGELVLLRAAPGNPRADGMAAGAVSMSATRADPLETFRKDLRFGCTRRVGVGDFLTPLAGDLNAMIEKCLAPRLQADSESHFEGPDNFKVGPGSSRMVMVPLVAADSAPGQIRCSVIGFARVFLRPLSNSPDGSVRAVFVSYVGAPPRGQEAAPGTIGQLAVF